MWTYLLGPVLSLLPVRWRQAFFCERDIHWTRATLISGVLEGGGCLLALIGWYFHFIQHAVREQAEAAAQALNLAKDIPAGTTNVGLSYSMGLASLTDFVMQPLTWVLAYFAVEGFWRTFAATVGDESRATGPLVLVDRLIHGGQRRAYEKRLPLVADKVTRGTEKDAWQMKVESCRPKPTWKYPLTVLYQDNFFQVAGEAAVGGTPTRPHVYLLRRVPAGEAYRGYESYDPNAVLIPPEKSPGFWATIGGTVRENVRLRWLPLVADQVYRGDGSQGWHLRVESCRPKPLWTYPRTIRFKNELYRVDGTYQAGPARPYGYRLRYLPANEAARGVLNYSPDEPLREAKS